MSTNIQYMESGTLAANQMASGDNGISPRRRRFGYNPGIYMMLMECHHSGRQQSLIPEGLVRFDTATLRVENFEINVDVDQYKKTVDKEFTAAWFLTNTLYNYRDQGFRELSCLTTLEDPERNAKGQITQGAFLQSAQGYFNQVHPSFAEIHYECPFELQNCATCRLYWLGNEDGPTQDIMRQRIAMCPDPVIAEKLRLTLRDSVIACLESFQLRWDSILGEMQGRKNNEPGIGKLDESCHHIRRHLHAHAPEDQQALVAAGFGAEVAAANAQATRELADAFREGNGGSSDELLRLVIETQRQQAEIIRQFADSIKGK